MTYKLDQKIAPILGIHLNSTSLNEVLKVIDLRVKNKQKTVIVTPNPEFVVYAQSHPWFAKILNSADMALPDGIGIIWAARFLKNIRLTRVVGADVTDGLMTLANSRGWQVGLVGLRRGVVEERNRLLAKLQKKYPRAKFYILEETPNWQKIKLDLVFACQGMGKQERWIQENFKTSEGLVFIGAGGSLDYLAGLVPRAPVWIRKLGVEWLYRLIRQPWRLSRQLNLLKFIWLVIKEKFSPTNFTS